MTPNKTQDTIEHLVKAYETMLGRVNEAIESAEQATIPALKKNIEHAREKAIEVGELTREEAEKIGAYLERDMHDAGEFLAQTGEEFRTWARFDLELIEDRILEIFASVADKTRLELGALAERARQASLYRTGEITGPGTLLCTSCSKEIHFHKTGHIPPCAGCRGTEYRRAGS
ncbi:hypothetical protein MNBD_GAMMA26-439 [hydrothermal vent metagenome]|uniref:Zinc ribbon-containing protein n=1 Tax=hydrothermal vent metagenome TaxID=652676 RepID=A0A3B1ALA2_9ZZZZ